MSPLSRRDFLKATAATVVAAQVSRVLGQPTNTAPSITGAPLRWLEPPHPLGSTLGVPWPRGTVPAGQTFALRATKGPALPVQSWPLAYWPDGSLKWTAHSVGAAAAAHEAFVLEPGPPAAPAQALTVQDGGDAIEIDTGVIRCRLPKKGGSFLESIARDGRDILRDGRLVVLSQDRPSLEGGGTLQEKNFAGLVESVTVEQSGPIRAVVRFEGRHQEGEKGRGWLPFTLRLYFYAGSDAVRVMHTFIYDGEEDHDFIRGLGIRFSVPMSDPLYDRHVRFAGATDGLWAEGVKNLTGLRRDPGKAVTESQLAGKACPPLETFPDPVKRNIDWIPVWNDYTLFQPSADSFEIRKRTSIEHSWLQAAQGGRASGLGCIGGATGGSVAFGLRDFWQKNPAQLDIRGAAGDTAEVTMWLWAPDARAMDMRFYHGEMGMDTFVKQRQGLEITYEDYQPGFATAYGVARTSEALLWALPATPTRERLVEMAATLRHPPQLACSPEHCHAAGVFGGEIWNLPDRSTPARRQLEDLLDSRITYYQGQIEQRRWYGFWNYGDVMHTYDPDRHVWRYDVGGYAWDNSELSPDLWLWYAYLRSGRADIFRMAEAMTRHTGEVDVYHIGRFAGLGTRHGVNHWGDSAKQLRISTAIYRRFYYYLTADERVGDLLRAEVNAAAKLAEVQPGRKLSPRPGAETETLIGVGTDWSGAASAWLTEWERTNSPEPRSWLENSMKVIGGNPQGFFAASFRYIAATKALVSLPPTTPSASHLSAVFGLFEVCAELIPLIDVPEFDRAWLQYCTLYSASPEEQKAALGVALKDSSLKSAHSRLTAYAAWRKNDPKLAARAWREYLMPEGKGPAPSMKAESPVRITGPAVLEPVEEIASVSTNGSAQEGLATIQNLALVGKYLPPTLP